MYRLGDLAERRLQVSNDLIYHFKIHFFSLSLSEFSEIDIISVLHLLAFAKSDELNLALCCLDSLVMVEGFIVIMCIKFKQL